MVWLNTNVKEKLSKTEQKQFFLYCFETHINLTFINIIINIGYCNTIMMRSRKWNISRCYCCKKFKARQNIGNVHLQGNINIKNMNVTNMQTGFFFLLYKTVF